MDGALGQVETAVDAVMIDPLWSLSDSEVADETCRLFVVMQRLSCRFAGLVAEAGSRQLGRQAGAATPTAWLAGLLALGGPQAHRWVKLAGLLEKTPTVAQALASGEITAEQARVIAQTANDLPAEVGESSKQHAVEVLTKLASQDRTRPEVLARHRQMILEMVAPEIAEERLQQELERSERSAYERRGVTLSPYGESEYRLRGILPAEAAAVVKAALDPLCAPGQATPDADANRRIDASGATTASSATTGFNRADGYGAADGLGSATGSDRVSGSGSASGFGCASGSDRADGCCAADGLGSATGSGHADGPGGRDSRNAAARRADALVEICRRILDAGELPESGGEKPHLVVTMSWEQLRDQVGAGLLDTGDLLTPETVRRLACDATIIPAVLGSDGQVLDVGRARRLIDGPLRRALVLRDRGCAWPGCERPSRWCHGHHIQAWVDGGPTSLANSVLLCGFHHREIHKGWWKVRIAGDGHPDFIPPTYLDPRQNPVRNSLHRRC